MRYVAEVQELREKVETLEYVLESFGGLGVEVQLAQARKRLREAEASQERWLQPRAA